MGDEGVLRNHCDLEVMIHCSLQECPMVLF